MINAIFKVDGEIWTNKQLEQLEYERGLHLMHQMARHGVPIKMGNRSLTEDEIDFLTKEQLKEVSLNIRCQYTGEKIREIYEDSFELSNKMWQKLQFSLEKPMKVSRCEMKVTGITPMEFMQIMKIMQADERIALEAHPEHFQCIMTEKDIIGIEPFGMYGTPTLCKVYFKKVEDLGSYIQKDYDATYEINIAGLAYLLDGETAINVPFHQFKATEDGFQAKLAVYWPEHTPDEVVYGHSLHLALEFYNGIKYNSTSLIKK